MNLYTSELSLFSFKKLPGVFSEDCCFHIRCHLRQLKQLSHDTSLLKERNKGKYIFDLYEKNDARTAIMLRQNKDYTFPTTCEQNCFTPTVLYLTLVA